MEKNNENTSLQLKPQNFIIIEKIEDTEPSDIGSSEHLHTFRKPKRKMSFGKKVALGATFALISGFGIGSGIGVGYSVASNMNQTAVPTVAHPSTEVLLAAASGNISTSMVDAVERALPSVVSIETAALRQGARGFSSPFFSEREIPASGTGIVFYQDNTNIYIVTNEHVISDATTISVYFGRGRGIGVEAFVKGRNVPSDLAVLYIPRSSLVGAGVGDIVVAEFGDSSEMRVGEFVMAIGNALGQGISTTIGVVSALDIEIQIDNRSIRALQTDAAINPGNSGGPLINYRGQVIGINTVKISRPYVYGMGYSITSNVAMPIIDGIMNETATPTLGIIGNSASNLDEYYIELFGLENDLGVFVYQVQPNSGAELGGLEPNDIITHFNGNVVQDMDMLREFIFGQSIGDTVDIGIIRDGDPMTINVELRQF